MENLKHLGVIPINKDILYSLYGNLKFPENKIADLERKGIIIRIKRGLYVVSKQIHNQEISRELVANHLYGPSYIPFETALAIHGLIPEKVFAVRSATFKRAKRFENIVGNFEYITVPQNYYSIGISRQIIDDKYSYLLATPEKALCDLIIATPNLRLQSVKAMQIYLEENLRIDFPDWQNIDINIISQCVETGRKKGELRQLLNFCSC
jgi:hypothetical protein